MALLVMAEAMVASGAITSLVNIFDTDNRLNNILLFTFILSFVAILSSVMNNTPVVVMFMPLIAALGEKKGVDASKTLLPLSYISMLGGMTTLMGSVPTLSEQELLQIMVLGQLEY